MRKALNAIGYIAGERLFAMGSPRQLQFATKHSPGAGDTKRHLTQHQGAMRRVLDGISIARFPRQFASEFWNLN